jgi:DNA-binding transcriptional LysR family regulator
LLLIQEVLFDLVDSKFTPPASVSLEHWRALVAVVDEGGYARAAEALGKSQSTVSHGIQRLEELLGTRVLRIEGRRAVLTDVGEVVLRRARYLLDEAGDIERVARRLAQGVEAEVCVAIDTVFPNQVLLPAVGKFSGQYPDTRIEIVETVISGVSELLISGQAQLAVTPEVPQGRLGSRLIELEMVCVARPDHPLHTLGRPINERDLGQHRQLVVRESGAARTHRAGWLSSEQRLTVSTMGTRIQALCQGLGFAWCPVLKIQRELEQGLLKPLQLSRGGSRFASLYLVFADEQGAGPATHSLARHIESEVASVVEKGLRKSVW